MSKAFVIKNKEGKYLGVARDHSYYWTDDIFNSYRFMLLSESHDVKAEVEKYRDINYPDCEVAEITIAEGDLEQENKQLKEQLAEKDKEIEKLYKIIDSQKRHIANTEKYFMGRGTKRTGNVILDFELQIRKQVCDEIRNLAHNYFELVICDNCGNTIDNDCYISSTDFCEILEKVEKGEE